MHCNDVREERTFLLPHFPTISTPTPAAKYAPGLISVTASTLAKLDFLEVYGWAEYFKTICTYHVCDTGSVILQIVDFTSLACQRKPLSGQAGEMERAVPPKFGSFATREGAEKEGVIITHWQYSKYLISFILQRR